MRCSSVSLPFAAAAMLVAGTHFALAGSVHSFTLPSRHVTVHHAYTSGTAPHRGFFSNVFHVVFGLDDGYDGPQMTDSQRPTLYQLSAIPSEAERYRLATGMALPASHGLIVLPPTTPKGDQTYIWPTSQD